MNNLKLSINGLVIEYVRPKKTLFESFPISFDLKEGQIMCIVGNSGCGKSSIIEACLGNVGSRGNINFWDKNYTVQFNDNKLLKEKTFGDNLREYLSLEPRLEKRETLKGYLQQIEEYLSKNENFSFGDVIENSSFGTRRRMDLYLRLFEPDKTLFFLDQPTQGLDPYSITKIVELIKKFHTPKNSFLIITHDEKVMKISTKALILSEKGYTIINKKDACGFVKIKKKDWEVLEPLVKGSDVLYQMAFFSEKVPSLILKTLKKQSHQKMISLILDQEIGYYIHFWKEVEVDLQKLINIYSKV